MIIPFLDLKSLHKPLEAEIGRLIKEVVQTQSFVLGSPLEKFEKEFSSYLNVPYTVGVNSGTDALIIALRVLDIGPGDEVITVPNSFFATAEAIVHCGAKPVFVDVNPETALMDISQVSQKMTSKTKAIIPVHLYGQPESMEPILSLAKTHNLKVIEDACQAHGSTYKGKKAGTFGDIGCFSFYPGKNLGGFGDGGALVTSDSSMAEKGRKLRNHGGIVKYEHDLIGYNSRLDNLQAVVLSLKLAYLDRWNEKRVQAAGVYCEKLSRVSGVAPFNRLPDRTSNFHLFVVKVDPKIRDPLMEHLKKNGISTGIHYPTPIHHLRAMKDFVEKDASFPVAEFLSRSILSLPMYPDISPEMVSHVVDCIKGYYAEA